MENKTKQNQYREILVQTMDNLVHSLPFTNTHKTTSKFSKGRKKCENVRRVLFSRIGHT